MTYKLVLLNDKWYVQTNSGKYLGGYASRALAVSLLSDLETA